MTTAEAAARALLAGARRRTFTLAARGVVLSALEWGDGEKIALLHHANGFCKGVWALVAAALGDEWRVIAFDARGHGDSTKPEGPAAYAWDEFAEDLLAVAHQVRDESGAPIALGIGHSFGGTSMIGAAARDPAVFARLLLVDPVVPPPPGLAGDRQPHVDRLVEGARRRRTEWPSRDAARRWCAERALFAGWRPEAIELYLLDGMMERPDGSLVLKCPGAIEAAVFAGSQGIDLFALARRADVPMLLLWARDGDFPRPVYEALAAAAPAARVETVEAGHLVVMQRPELVVDAARRATS